MTALKIALTAVLLLIGAAVLVWSAASYCLGICAQEEEKELSGLIEED